MRILSNDAQIKKKPHTYIFHTLKSNKHAIICRLVSIILEHNPFQIIQLLTVISAILHA